MRIEKFISGVECLDGGTTFYEVLLGDGSVLNLGRYGQTIPERVTHGMLFFGNSSEDGIYLVRGSPEESELLALISEYLDRNCDGSWRESLQDGERQAEIENGDDSVQLALGFLSAILKKD